MQGTTIEASAAEVFEREISGVGAGMSDARVPARKTEWLRAFKAVRRLIADKDDTRQVFEIMNALAGRSIPKGYSRLLDHPGGGEVAYNHEELADYLDRHDQLATLPDGSLGQAYLAFVQAQQFSAYGLADESRKVADTLITEAHPYAWYARRLRDVHDIWHVLTGYDADALGEGCLVAFSYSQTRNRGFALIAWAVAIQFMRARTGYPAARAVIQAFRDGRRARWLPAADYRALMALPLEEARRVMGIVRPTLYEQVPVELRNAYRGAKPV